MDNFLIITGATSDLGMALARRVQDDYALILSGRNVKALDALALGLKDPSKHAILPLDMAEFGAGNSGAVESKIDSTNSPYKTLKADDLKASLSAFISSDKCGGGGSHCQNNGALVESKISLAHLAALIPYAGVKGFDLSLAHKAFDVTFFSFARLCRLLLRKPFCIKSIFAMSSVSAIKAYKGASIYGAAKAALDVYVRALALEENVNASSLQLYAVKTRSAEKFEALDFSTPAGEITPADVAEQVEVMLNTELFKGKNLLLDGGKLVM